MYEYEVLVRVYGTQNVVVKARNPDDAMEKAEKMCDLDIDFTFEADYPGPGKPYDRG